VVTSRTATTRFASEMEAERTPEGAGPAHGAHEVKETISKRETSAPVELVPVAASVFDDDFFRAPAARGEKSAEVDRVQGVQAERTREATHFSVPLHVQQEHAREVTNEVGDSSVRVSAFDTAASADHAEPDELDIPAFLRRGN
jgi:cell division protein FtsZ